MNLTEFKTNAITWASSNRTTIIIVIIGLLLFPAGFLTGKYATPTKVVETQTIVEKVVEKVVFQDKIVEKIVYVQAKKEKTHKESTSVETPDGTKTVKTTETTSTDTDTKVDKDKTEETVRVEEKVVERVVEKLKLVESARPGWRVSAGAGIAIPVLFLGADQIGIPGLKGAVVQVEVSRRIVGPLWFSLNGNSQGLLGASLGGEF